MIWKFCLKILWQSINLLLLLLSVSTINKYIWHDITRFMSLIFVYYCLNIFKYLLYIFLPKLWKIFKKYKVYISVLVNLPPVILFIFSLILKEIQKPAYRLPNGKQWNAEEKLHLSCVVKKDIFRAESDWGKLQLWIKYWHCWKDLVCFLYFYCQKPIQAAPW